MQLVRNVVSVDFHVTKYKTIVIELTKEVSQREREKGRERERERERSKKDNIMYMYIL